MNRRAFLGWLIGTAAGVAAAPYLDVDKLLWVPKPIITVPAFPGGNHFVTPEWVVRETLAMFEKNLQMLTLFDRQYDDTFHRGAMVLVAA